MAKLFEVATEKMLYVAWQFRSKHLLEHLVEIGNQILCFVPSHISRWPSLSTHTFSSKPKAKKGGFVY
ncbi:hypothetical protein NCGM1179_3187 [Pseudomonas aeruginosa NCMG1179]|nr:hypothetical protein NCGM1179_3187 [Pseudomonas aeruginosa NCMG1179]